MTCEYVICYIYGMIWYSNSNIMGGEKTQQILLISKVFHWWDAKSYILKRIGISLMIWFVLHLALFCIHLIFVRRWFWKLWGKNMGNLSKWKSNYWIESKILLQRQFLIIATMNSNVVCSICIKICLHFNKG